jgi:SAM-dependent methyltransferase
MVDEVPSAKKTTDREFSMYSRLVSFRQAAYSTVLIAGFGISAALAQSEPRLDVIYVPTPQALVDRMLQMAEVKANDFVIDLGCGDGRMVVTAASKYGATGYGVDINPVRVEEANANAKKAGVTDKVSFKIADLFQEDISKASVMTMYLLNEINLRLRPKILSDLKPGSRVVSHAFTMDDWEPDQRDVVENKNIYFWYVPAKVEGKWQVEGGEQKLTLDLTQKFQMVSGKAEIDGKSVNVSGRLKGTEFTFTIDRDGKKQEYKGIVDGGQIKGVNAAWQARKS